MSMDGGSNPRETPSPRKTRANTRGNTISKFGGSVGVIGNIIVPKLSTWSRPSFAGRLEDAANEGAAAGATAEFSEESTGGLAAPKLTKRSVKAAAKAAAKTAAKTTEAPPGRDAEFSEELSGRSPTSESKRRSTKTATKSTGAAPGPGVPKPKRGAAKPAQGADTRAPELSPDIQRGEERGPSKKELADLCASGEFMEMQPGWCRGMQAIYVAEGRREVVKLLKSYSMGDGGGFSAFVPSRGREVDFPGDSTRLHAGWSARKEAKKYPLGTFIGEPALAGSEQKESSESSAESSESSSASDGSSSASSESSASSDSEDGHEAEIDQGKAVETGVGTFASA
eukprot:CAMPEP_0171698562 /NCGR_PEP_ID=MMETSP0991-20121206/9430_1 /TAXON_ID=483369 /ORGANISM="non described non described, Strain CCMP2098" /LENGTH=340 /DNA_ID=CAMNT_0012287449 /DNA_START=88 /DNA_END=1106 /DNA_ORIENTATION=-